MCLVLCATNSRVHRIDLYNWLPPTFSNESTNCLFLFHPTIESKSVIAEFQFTIISSHGQFVYYYYPYGSGYMKSFDSFCDDICDAVPRTQANMDNRSDGSGADRFDWLKAYQRDDQTQIDRNIADGTVTLQRRESKFREELKRREFEYIMYKDFKIFTATWNVNGRPCDDIDLKDWLSVTNDPPDIYAVAFQELDLSTLAIARSDSRPDAVWM